MRSPPLNSFKTQWWGHRCYWRKKLQKVRRCRCRCHRPIEPIKKVRWLGVWNPRKKTHSLFLCNYGSVVQNPVTDSVLEPDIDQRRADQEADLRGFDHGGRGVLMAWKQWEKFGGLHVGVVNMDRWLGLLMILAWVVIWVSFVFNLYLWSGSVFVFGLCFFSFFCLCCCDLGLSFWLLDLCSRLLGLI